MPKKPDLPVAKIQLNNKRMSELICEQISDWIMDGTLEAGQRISEDELAERFGVSREKLWQAYLEQQAHPVLKPEFVSRLEQLVTDGEVVTLVSLYAHLLDQYAWELLPAAETAAGCQQLLQLLAACLQVPEPPGTPEFTTRQAVTSLTQLLVQKLLV